MSTTHWGQMIKLKMSGTLANTGGAEGEREESVEERNIRVDTGGWFWFGLVSVVGTVRLVGGLAGRQQNLGWLVGSCVLFTFNSLGRFDRYYLLSFIEAKLHLSMGAT